MKIIALDLHGNQVAELPAGTPIGIRFAIRIKHEGRDRIVYVHEVTIDCWSDVPRIIAQGEMTP